MICAVTGRPVVSARIRFVRWSASSLTPGVIASPSLSATPLPSGSVGISVSNRRVGSSAVTDLTTVRSVRADAEALRSSTCPDPVVWKYAPRRSERRTVELAGTDIDAFTTDASDSPSLSCGV